MAFLAHKQGVIEFNHVAPSKVMTIEAGVELVEKGKSTKGQDYNIDGKFKLADYRKLHDTRTQQVTDTLKHRKNEMSNASAKLNAEDPYRSFRRSLIQ